VKRRTFIAGLGSVAALPVAARAQQMRRIGVLMSGDENNDPVWKPRLSAFTQALADLGWNDGRNVRMDFRWYGDDSKESISRFITQKLKLKVNEAKSAVARPQERKFGADSEQYCSRSSLIHRHRRRPNWGSAAPATAAAIPSSAAAACSIPARSRRTRSRGATASRCARRASRYGHGRRQHRYRRHQAWHFRRPRMAKAPVAQTIG
jgi:hypothetical protein